MRHNMSKKTLYTCQKGASAVEFAIVLPLLLVFVFGIIEFGILLYNKAVITNASREGARAASIYYTDVNNNPIPMPATGDPSVQKVVTDYCTNHLITFGGSTTPTVTTTGPTDPPPNEYRSVTVEFGYNFLVLPNILAGFFGGPLLGPIPLKAVTQMRTEYQGGL